MADTATIDAAGIATEPANSGGGEDSKVWSIPGSPEGLPDVSINSLLIHGVRAPLEESNYRIPLKAKERLVFRGANLGRYNRAEFLDGHSGGILGKAINDSYGNKVLITLGVPDLGNYRGRIFLRLVSDSNKQSSRIISPYGQYFIEDEEKDKTKTVKVGRGTRIKILLMQKNPTRPD